ncbi:haloalkane dehalogenase [Pseudomonadota bacterium]
MNEQTISSDNPYAYKKISVGDADMAYIEVGSGDPIVLLHGNPTSSYIWRNVIPHLETLGRCLAPDLVGMGQSGKSPDNAYRFLDHCAYMETWLDKVVPGESITFVVQDWGAALAFDWSNRHRNLVKAICYMEAMVRPRKWSDLPKPYEKTFRGFRTDEGKRNAMEANLFIEKVLPNGVARELSEKEMSTYRAPFQELTDRLPTIIFPMEIPFDGEPADNHERVKSYSEWLATCTIPKLFVNTSDGHALIGPNREFCRSWLNQQEITLQGKHYIQEDSPHELGKAIAKWIESLA